ncbi:unnamed protein product [Blepharisma stoltei]|uniref:Receptor ligand binding region domain-containing protein n=1 Tax=Blepharisma stoltei TaxID=1481888 RepID=A0AAU9KA35_9CILI|nr:unnamed protein product [Blepharisma stoltei]
MVLLFLMILKIALADLTLYVFFSQNTPQALQAYFTKSLSSLIGSKNYWDILFYQVDETTDLSSYFEKEVLISFDATYDNSLSQTISALTENYNILNFFFSPTNRPLGSWQFYIHTDPNDEIAAIKAFTDYLEWKRILVVGDGTIEAKIIATQFQENYSEVVQSQITVSPSTEQSVVDNIAGRLIKPNGQQTFVVVCEGAIINKFTSALVTKKIYKQGAGIVLWSRGIWGGDLDGLIYVVEKGLESAISMQHYEALALKYFTDQIGDYWNSTSNSENQAMKNLEIKKYLEQITRNHKKLPYFSIVNIDGSVKTTKGDIYGNELSITGVILYPGSSTTKPKNSKTSLKMSISTNGLESDGTYNSYNPLNCQGNIFAKEWINNQTWILENFEIDYTSNTCGVSVFVHDTVLKCLTPLISDLGYVWLGSDWAASNVGYMALLRELNISMVTVAAGPNSPIFSNKTAYPEFMRMVPSANYNAVIMIKLCQIFSWKNVVVVYSNVSANIAIYEVFKSEADSAGITIANDEDKRMLPLNYARTQYQEYKYIFDHIRDTNVRIFVTFQTASSNYQAVEGLYDSGLRSGEIICFFPTKTGGQSTFSTMPAASVVKLANLMNGAISVSAIEYTGTFGNEIKTLMAAYWGNTPSFKATHFDNTFFSAYGLDTTINRGEDFENSTILNRNLRKQRITSASGVISIDSSSNDRSYMVLDILNTYQYVTNSSFVEVIAGNYIPTSSNPIQFYTNLTWPGYTSTTPTDTRTPDSSCPFDESDATTSVKGIAALATICISMALMAILIAIFIWKQYSHSDVKKLTEPKEIQFADSIIFATMIIETFQYINIGPSFNSDPITGYIGGVFNIDLKNVVSLKGDTYFAFMDVVFTLVGFWLLMFIILIRTHTGCVEKIWIFKFLSTSAHDIMSILGNLLFLPIMTSLLSVFQCSKSIGDNLEDSYMDIDCNQYCWTGRHLSYAISSIIALLIYFPLAVIYRPVWQSLQLQQNLRCQPKYLLIKSCAQVIFITVNKTLKLVDSIAQGLTYLLLFSLFIFYNLKFKPYNYDRANMWQVILFICVAWSVLFSSISKAVDTGLIVIMIIKIIGWSALITIGFVLQVKKFPSLLYRPQPQSIAKLFLFLLTSKVSAQELDKRALKYVVSKKGENKDDSSIIQIDDKTQAKVSIIGDESTRREMLGMLGSFREEGSPH